MALPVDIKFNAKPNNQFVANQYRFTVSGGIHTKQLMQLFPLNSVFSMNNFSYSAGSLNYNILQLRAATATELGHVIFKHNKSYISKIYEFEFDPDGYYNLKFDASFYDESSSGFGGTLVEVFAYDFLITQSNLDDALANGYVIKVDRTGTPIFEAVVGTGLYQNDYLILEALEYFEFEPTGSSFNEYLVDGTLKTSYALGKVFPDLKKAEVKVTRTTREPSFKLSVLTIDSTPEPEPEPEPDPSEGVSANNKVYKITSETLNELNLVRFFFPVGEERSYDYGQYILSVLELPFDINPALIGELADIKLGTLETGIIVPSIITDKIRVNLGVIEVVGEFNNLLDYKNTTAILHLPRTKSVTLDINYVIGSEVSIEYIIDCYSGNATVNISSSKIGSVINSFETSLGVNIPYINVSSSDSISNNSVVVGGDNGVITPFIELIKYQPLLTDGFFTIPVKDEGVLLLETGFIKVENIDLKVNATLQEQELIINLLKNGVVINE